MRSLNWTVRFGIAVAILLTSALAQPSSEEPANPEAKLLDSSDGHDWPGYGRTYGEQHYSPLTQINAEDIDRLGLVWSMDLGPEKLRVAADRRRRVALFRHWIQPCSRR